MDLATVEKLLTTTRSVRKRLDLERPVAPELIEACIEMAIQAPTGGNGQNWYFMVVTDAEKKAKIGELYKQSFEIYAGGSESRPARVTHEGRSKLDVEQFKRVASSAAYLAEVMGQVPAMLIPCYTGRVEQMGSMVQAGFYGSILPAAWSFMLAARAHGLGCSWTTLHLRYEKEIAEILGIPDHITQVALLPIAYYTGEDFSPANRHPKEHFTFWDGWDNTLG